MAKIVSGNQAPTGLEQFAFFHDLTSKAKARKDQQEQQAFDNQLQFQKLMLAMQQEQVKSKQLLNRAAEAGDVKALQKMVLDAKKDPATIALEEADNILAGIEDEKMLPRAEKAIAELYKEAAKFKKGQAFEQMLGEAEASPNLFPPEKIQDWRQRAATGEQLDTLSKEVMGVRQKAGEEATNMTENQEALMQATQAIQALPKDSYERRDAEVALNAALADEGALKRQGFGAGVLKAVQGAALGAAQGFPERQAALGEWRTRQQGAKPAPGLQGMTVGQRNEQMEKEPWQLYGIAGPVMGGEPKVPAYTGGSGATRKSGVRRPVKPEALRALVEQAIGENPKDKVAAIKWLKAQGLDVTRDMTTQINAIMQEIGSSGNAAAGPAE